MYSSHLTGRVGTHPHAAPTLKSGHVERLHAPAPIELRVNDMAASRKFYSDLFGFVLAEGFGFSDGRMMLISPLLAHGYRCIVLTRDPRATSADGVMLELETSGELLDRYFLARLLGAQTTPLISRGRNLLVSVRDPDGHRIELRTSQARPRQAGSVDDEHALRWGRDQAPTTAPGRFRREEHLASSEESISEDPLLWFDALCEGKQPGPKA